MTKDPRNGKAYFHEFLQKRIHSSSGDVQIHNRTANVKTAGDILTPIINLLLPPFNKEPEPEELQALVKMLPETLQPVVSALNVELTMFRQASQT